VHRTVRWSTGQCLVRQASSGELAALGKKLTVYGYNSSDCPVCTGLSGEPTVGRANSRPRDPRETRGRANSRKGGTGLSGVHRTVSGAPTVGFAKQGKKSAPDSVWWCTGQCPVVHRTVWCARRQKARIAFLECTQRLLAALGL
jgi:hypothetical protein